LKNSSFAETHNENILLVKNFELLQNKNIGCLSEICREQFCLNPDFNQQRIDNIAKAIDIRLINAQNIIPVQKIFTGYDSF